MQAQSQIAQLQTMIGGGGMPIPGMMGAQIPDPLATQVLTLTNCFDLEELDDAESYEEIKEDMEEECGKYGQVGFRV